MPSTVDVSMNAILDGLGRLSGRRAVPRSYTTGPALPLASVCEEEESSSTIPTPRERGAAPISAAASLGAKDEAFLAGTVRFFFGLVGWEEDDGRA
jgi:hypothetical protein